MVNKPKARGTAGETAVVRYLREHGFGGAERRALRGTMDAGDVTGLGPICMEVKSGDVARAAITATRSSGQIDEWLAETETERLNAGADIGVLVVQTPGTTDPGRWWAVVTSSALLDITLAAPAASGPEGWPDVPVRLHLADLVVLLRAAGYGDPLDTSAALAAV